MSEKLMGESSVSSETTLKNIAARMAELRESVATSPQRPWTECPVDMNPAVLRGKLATDPRLEQFNLALKRDDIHRDVAGVSFLEKTDQQGNLIGYETCLKMRGLPSPRTRHNPDGGGPVLVDSLDNPDLTLAFIIKYVSDGSGAAGRVSCGFVTSNPDSRETYESVNHNLQNKPEVASAVLEHVVNSQRSMLRSIAQQG